MNFQTNIKHTKYRIHGTKCRISKLFNTFNKLRLFPTFQNQEHNIFSETESILRLAQLHQGVNNNLTDEVYIIDYFIHVSTSNVSQ